MAIDELKPLHGVIEPDVRSKMLEILDPEVGFRPVTLSDHHQEVAAIGLPAALPAKLREQFEVSKNLLLYSWFVYRFIPVAEFHALSTLELGLKLRFRLKKSPGLKGLIRRAIDEGLVTNEDFASYRNLVRSRREQWEMFRQISEASGSEIEPLEPPPDYLSKLLDSVPALRNEYAHGSSLLHPHGIASLEVVADFLAAVFADEN